MADTNAQMEELARILEEVNREMAYYGRITKQTADDKFDAEVKAKLGINNATKGLEKMGEALTGVASAAGAAGKAMYEGKKGAAAFNDSIDGLTKAAQAAGVALSLMIPGGPLIKLFVAGMTAAVTATAEYVKAANEMADKLYKGYSGLAKSGAAASDGMTGVYRDAKKLGLSMNELDGYIGLIGQNSKDLALLSGSVYEGRKQFADMGEAMEPFRKSLFAAGLNQEQINEGSMGYLKLQTRIGVAQRMTTDQLAEGARRYLIEQDALSKMTGQSRKEMEDQMEAARSEQRFRAKLEEVRATQGEDAAKRLEQANILISSQSKEMGQAFRDISTGMIGTEAAQKGMMGTNGELMRSSQQLAAGQIDQFQAVTKVGKAAGQFAKDMNMSAQLGTFEDMATNYAGQLQLGIFAEQDKSEMMKKISEEQRKQGLEGGAAVDKLTEQYAKNTKQQQELNKKMEDAVFQGIDNALTVTKKLGDVTDSLANAFTKLADATNKLLRILGLGSENTPQEQAQIQTEKRQDAQNFENATFGEKMQSGMARGLERFARGTGRLIGSKSLVNLADTAQQSRIASESQYLQQQGRFQQVPPGQGVPAEATSGTIKLEDYINFGSNTGDRAHFDQLHPTIRESFVQMAKQYFETTGNKLQVNSAFRSAEEQGKVNAGPNPKAAPGMSLHQQGRAVDINSDQRSALERMGLLGQYGFNPLPDDPPHIFMAKGGIVGARAGGTEIIAGEAGQDEAVIPLEGGAVPVSLNMKPSAVTDDITRSFEAGFSQMTAAFAKLTDIDVISQTLAQIKNRQFGLADATDIVKSEDTASTKTMTEMSGNYERMLATALEKQAAQQEEQSMRMIDALTEMIRAQKDSNSIQEKILQTSM